MVTLSSLADQLAAEFTLELAKDSDTLLYDARSLIVAAKTDSTRDSQALDSISHLTHQMDYTLINSANG